MIRHPRSRCTAGTRAGTQRGVALVVALVLLLVATLIGLAASRDTLLQERMSSNSYDRSLAFQRSESALRFAETQITTDGSILALGGVDCSIAPCPIVPANSFTGTSASWRDVDATFDVNNALTPGIPQYHIAFMGIGPGDGAGQDENAAANEGIETPLANVAFYRVTARSSDPATLGGRSIVVLQTTVKRPM